MDRVRRGLAIRIDIICPTGNLPHHVKGDFPIFLQQGKSAQFHLRQLLGSEWCVFPALLYRNTIIAFPDRNWSGNY